MQEIMNTTKPAMLALEKHGMQLDNISKSIDNNTAAEIDQATLDNIKGRNKILEADIGSYDQKTQNDFELHKARIAEIEAKLKEIRDHNIINGEAIGVEVSEVDENISGHSLLEHNSKKSK